MYYTYIIESKVDSTKHYIGHTADLQKRLNIHNNGKSTHTANFRPWRLKLYIAFEKLEQAKKFEIYLKSGSGHAFAKNHFWS